MKRYPDAVVLFFDADTLWIETLPEFFFEAMAKEYETEYLHDGYGKFRIARAQRMRGVHTGVWMAGPSQADMFDHAHVAYVRGLQIRGDEGAVAAAMRDHSMKERYHYEWLPNALAWQSHEPAKLFRNAPEIERTVVLHPPTRDFAAKLAAAKRYLPPPVVRD